MSGEITRETFESLGESLLGASHMREPAPSYEEAFASITTPATCTNSSSYNSDGPANADPLAEPLLEPEDNESQPSSQPSSPLSQGRLLDRDGAFWQSRGRWGIRRVSEGERLRRNQLGDLRRLWEDWFHSVAYKPTIQLVLILFLCYTGLVVFFAEVYYAVSLIFAKSIVHPDGSSEDNFCDLDINTHMESLYFSLSTMTTIGYGVSDYYFGGCVTPLVLVLWQSCVAITFQSVAIGLLFSRISRGQKRSKTIIFSNQAVVQRVEGRPYLMMRIGEMRRNCLIEVTVRMYSIRHERYQLPAAPKGEGEESAVETYHFMTRPMKLIYPDERMGHQILMSLPQVVVHPLDGASPLLPKQHEVGKQSLDTTSNDDISAFWRDRDAEIIVLVEGTDELTGAAVQARQSYRWNDMAFDCTFAPCVQPTAPAPQDEDESPTTRRSCRRQSCARRRAECPMAEVDFAKLHDVIPASPNAPYCPYLPTALD